MMRANRIGGLIIALALTAQVTGACTFRSALGNMVASSAQGTEVAATPSAPAVEPIAVANEDMIEQGGQFRWSERMDAGRVIEVKGVNGHVRAEGSTGAEVEVVATKRARRSDPASVRLEVVRHGAGVTICAVYPSPKAEKPNRCGAGEDGRMSVNNNDVQVDFTVRVPAGVRFNGRTVNGGVDVDDMRADVEAYTVNGGVRVSTTGLARAQTVNGSINVSMGQANWSSELGFETVNGSIELVFPQTLGADVLAETLNGSISTDFPMTVQGTTSRRRLEGVIGSGGRSLRLKTINGNVEIRRAQ